MALADITPKLTVVADMTQSTPRFTFQDKTDYTSESVTVGNVKGLLSITVNGTSIHQNTDWANPDIDGSSSGQTNTDLTRFRTEGNYISVPLTSSEFTNGSYKFVYTVSDDGGTTTVESEITLDLTYSKVTGEITRTLNLNPFNVYLTGEDTTDYDVDSVTPTVTRTLDLYFPQGSGATNLSTSSATLTTTNVYTGVQTFDMTSDLSYDFSSKTLSGTTNDYASGNFVFTLLDEIRVISTQVVEDKDGVCSVYCCVKDLNSRVEAAKGNPTKHNQLVQKSSLVGMKLGLLWSAYDCNDTDSTVINAIINQIKDICDCTGDCGCSEDGVPTLITSISNGLTPLNNFIVYESTNGQDSLTVPQLIGKTYTSASGAGAGTNLGTPIRRDFLVYADQTLRNIQFTSSTGLIEFVNFGTGNAVQLGDGEPIEIHILR